MQANAERSRRSSLTSRPRETVRVREARSADVEPMVGLLASLFKQEKDFTPDPRKQKRALEVILSQPTVGRLFVATRGAQILGMVSLLFTISTAEGGKVAWLEDLVVRPDLRGRGLGTRLLRAAVDWAQRQGLTRITLLTDADNVLARRLYLRHGFMPSAMQPLRLHMDRQVSLRTASWTRT